VTNDKWNRPLTSRADLAGLIASLNLLIRDDRFIEGQNSHLLPLPDVIRQTTILFAVATCLTFAVVTRTHADPREWSGYVSVESRSFPQSAISPDQSRADVSVVFSPEYDVVYAGGSQAISFEGFIRLDGMDSDRTHWDIRELFWEEVWDAWELRVGVRHIFWGVTESQHLVDIVNQTDGVERPDGEAKLGQPMVQLSLIRGWGTLDLFFLPWFRERPFPGNEGRLRPPLPISKDATYAADDVERHLNFAGRWSHFRGPFDFGLSHFYGTARDPLLLDDGQGSLRPHYARIHQTGLDAQAITGGWLWKLEVIHRSGQGDRFTALTGGLEYTFSNVKRSGADVGLLMEYLWDQRDAGPSPFGDDVFVGSRLALNDVQSSVLLAGVVVDHSSATTALFVEASRRVGASWKVELEARAFANVDPLDPFYAFRRDSHFELKVRKYF